VQSARRISLHGGQHWRGKYSRSPINIGSYWKGALQSVQITFLEAIFFGFLGMKVCPVCVNRSRFLYRSQQPAVEELTGALSGVSRAPRLRESKLITNRDKAEAVHFFQIRNPIFIGFRFRLPPDFRRFGRKCRWRISGVGFGNGIGDRRRRRRRRVDFRLPLRFPTRLNRG